MQTTELRASPSLEKGKSHAARRRGARPSRYRACPGHRPTARPLDTPPLRYQVASLQHWLDLNA